MNGVKGSEVPEVLPQLLPHNGFVIASGGGIAVRGGEDEAVIGACHHLSVALDDLLQLEAGPRSLVVLRHGEFRDLHHVGVADVLNGLPTAQSRTFPPGSLGGGHGKDDEEEEDKAFKSHCAGKC